LDFGLNEKRRVDYRLLALFTVRMGDFAAIERKGRKGEKAMARRWMAKNEQRVAPLETVEAVENG
jgi:hypothetical protein